MQKRERNAARADLRRWAEMRNALAMRFHRRSSVFPLGEASLLPIAGSRIIRHRRRTSSEMHLAYNRSVRSPFLFTSQIQISRNIFLSTLIKPKTSPLVSSISEINEHASINL